MRVTAWPVAAHGDDARSTRSSRARHEIGRRCEADRSEKIFISPVCKANDGESFAGNSPELMPQLNLSQFFSHRLKNYFRRGRRRQPRRTMLWRALAGWAGVSTAVDALRAFTSGAK